MNNKLFNTKTKHVRAGHFRKPRSGGHQAAQPVYIPTTVVNGTAQDKKALEEQAKKAALHAKRSAAAKKAWETIRKKKAEAAKKKGKNKTQYRSIDDEGDYGEQG